MLRKNEGEMNLALRNSVEANPGKKGMWTEIFLTKIQISCNPLKITDWLSPCGLNQNYPQKSEQIKVAFPQKNVANPQFRTGQKMTIQYIYKESFKTLFLDPAPLPDLLTVRWPFGSHLD